MFRNIDVARNTWRNNRFIRHALEEKSDAINDSP